MLLFQHLAIYELAPRNYEYHHDCDLSSWNMLIMPDHRAHPYQNTEKSTYLQYQYRQQIQILACFACHCSNSQYICTPTAQRDVIPITIEPNQIIVLLASADQCLG